jgi:hypothetical protein
MAPRLEQPTEFDKLHAFGQEKGDPIPFLIFRFSKRRGLANPPAPPVGSLPCSNEQLGGRAFSARTWQL